MSVQLSAPADEYDPPEAQVDAGELQIDGARIRYRIWGEPGGDTDLVLVHGSAAHARWWDHIAPWLCTRRRVLALDLSGHGESDHRPRYARAQWAAEVRAAAALVGPRPIVVGHSLGGFVALEAGGRYGDEFGGIVVVDSPIRDDPAAARQLEVRAERAHRVYPRAGDLVDRFRPLPEYRPLPPTLARHIGWHSIRRTEEGYVWSFDPNIFGSCAMLLDELRPTGCPVALIRAESGALDPEMSSAAAEILGDRTIQLTIPDAGHSVMLDQPAALTAAIDALVAAWAATHRNLERTMT
jgi:pimeloyl-ACP methyl ester carboxylesterase